MSQIGNPSLTGDARWAWEVSDIGGSGTPLGNVVRIVAGGRGTTLSSHGHNVVQLADGTAASWGYNGDGQIGNGASGGIVGVPSQVNLPIP